MILKKKKKCFFFLVKRAGRHFGFFKRAGRHEKGAGRRALQKKPRQNNVNNTCTCRLCGERQPTQFHLLSCRTSTLARHIVITPVNVNKLVNVLYVIYIDVLNVQQLLCNVNILSTFFLIMKGYDLMCTFYILV